MIEFLVVESKSALYVFKKQDGKREIQYINGNPFFRYERTSMSHDIEEFMNYLRDEYNTDTTAEFEIELLKDSKSADADALIKCFGNFCSVKSAPLQPVLMNVYRRLEADKSLMIGEYGINYNGSGYKLLNGKLTECRFDLLAYTLANEDIVKYI